MVRAHWLLCFALRETNSDTAVLPRIADQAFFAFDPSISGLCRCETSCTLACPRTYKVKPVASKTLYTSITIVFFAHDCGCDMILSILQLYFYSFRLGRMLKYRQLDDAQLGFQVLHVDVPQVGKKVEVRDHLFFRPLLCC